MLNITVKVQELKVLQQLIYLHDLQTSAHIASVVFQIMYVCHAMKLSVYEMNEIIFHFLFPKIIPIGQSSALLYSCTSSTSISLIN